LTQEDFDNFRIGPHYLGILGGATPPRIPPPGNNRNNSTSGHGPVSDFKKGIKRDQSLFPTLKDTKQWDRWQRGTLAQARAQGVSEILDPKFAPSASSPEEVTLFEEKQKYMYAVFERTLLTDTGKAAVRKHFKKGNAQKIFAEVSAAATKSTEASLASTGLMTYITTTRLGDGTWNGPSHGFIMHWQEQVWKYQDLVADDQKISEGMQRNLLENAVFPIKELCQVKSESDQHKVQTGKDFTYDQYVSLLLSAASTYDAQFQNKRPGSFGSNKRSVYAHEFDDVADDDPLLEDHYNIDSDVTTLQANAHLRGSRMKAHQWHKLSTEDQQKWDSLSDETKAVILGNDSNTTPNSKQPFQGNRFGRGRGKGFGKPNSLDSNLHEISAYDFLEANLHDARVGSEGDVDDFSTPFSADQSSGATQGDNDNPLLAHATKQHTGIHPADLSKMMSSSMNKAPQEQPKKIVTQIVANIGHGSSYWQVVASSGKLWQGVASCGK